VVDFHSLRHTCGSLLVASGVHPKVAQTIMRHSDINLTMSLYSHTYREQEADAVAKLPDLTPPDDQRQRATGTYNATADDSVLALRLAQKSGNDETDTDSVRLSSRDDDVKNRDTESHPRDSNPRPVLYESTALTS